MRKKEVAMKKQWVLSVLFIVLCLALGFTQMGEAETQPFQKSEIAFHSNRDGNFEIYVMNADGTEQKRLTDHPTQDDKPCWALF